jgi:DHA1 family multidrug/chloramphenicol efflux transport protein-like MFS transporter
MFEKRRHLLYFSLFFIVYELTIYLSNDMIMPAMLQVVHDFHASNSNIAFSLSLYILGGSLLQIFLGPIADRVGKRRVMLAGNALFLLATVFIPFAHSMTGFLTARFFQGMGSCFIFIGYAMIHELFDDAQAVKLTTILSNTAVFAPLIGPVVGSAVIGWFPWQSVFAISLALGVVSWIGFFKFMPTGKTVTGQFNVAAIKASYLVIFRNKQFMFGILIAAISIAPLTAWIGLSPVIIMENMHASYGVYIVYQCVIFSGFILSSFAIQKLANDFSMDKLIRQGGGLALVGMLGAGLLREHGHFFIVCMFVFSAGFGLFNGALIRLSLTATGESMSLTSSAMSLLYCLYLSAALEIYNLVCDKFGYSLSSYALFNVPLGLLIYFSLLRFIRTNASRQLLPRPSS